MKILRYILSGFILMISVEGAAAELTPNDDPVNSYRNLQENPDRILENIKKGIATGEISLITKYLTDRSYLSLFNGVNGYFSSSKSFYVLQDFFRINRPLGFTFSMKSDGKNPYAAGEWSYESRGMRKKAQVYIALIKTGKEWKISQLSIK